MGDIWSGRLSEFVDDELSADERTQVEVHLDTCDECRQAVDELRLVAERASGLGPMSPPRDLWPDIHDRIRSSGVIALSERRAQGRRRIALSVPQLAAAAAVLLLVGAAAMRIGLSPSATPTGGQLATGGLVAPAAMTVSEPGVLAVIDELQIALRDHRAQLDTATVRVLEENLATIDRAIAEAQEALAADPANHYLNAHLAATLRTKVRLLNRATALISAAS